MDDQREDELRGLRDAGGEVVGGGAGDESGDETAGTGFAAGELDHAVNLGCIPLGPSKARYGLGRMTSDE